MSTFRGAPAKRSLDLASRFGDYQREWFAGVRSRVAAGEPLAVINATAPQEIFRTLEIPYVVAQWWSALVAAKQKAPQYLGHLRELGYEPDLEGYTALGFGSFFEDDPETAPWGGLPAPAILHAITHGDAMRKLFEAWARNTGAECLLVEQSSSWRPEIEPDWWARSHDGWEELIETDRLDLLTDELKALVHHLELRTGRRWSETRFAEVMRLVNEQEEWYARTRDLIAAARPAPVSIADTMPATMIPQWHRGTEWGRDAARLLHDGVKERVDAGEAACPDEQIRLMWSGVGLWFNMAFYESFQESHGAVFVWSMYLGLAADGYIRYFDGGRDPMRALAARFVTMTDELRGPTWSSQWHLKEALGHGVDGVVALGRLPFFDRLAFGRAGIPFVELDVSNVDPRRWDDERIRGVVEAFLDTEAGPRAAERRKREGPY